MDELEILRESCRTLPQQYQYLNVMGEASKSYPFEYFVEWVFVYRPNGENVDSLNKNNPTCEKRKYLSFTINEEAINTYKDIMWKKFCSKGDENNLDTPLKEVAEIHEVENESPQGDCIE